MLYSTRRGRAFVQSDRAEEADSKAGDEKGKREHLYPIRFSSSPVPDRYHTRLDRLDTTHQRLVNLK